MEQIPIIDVLRRRALMIFAICIVAGPAGYGLSLLISKRYEAAALVLVRPQEPIRMDARKADKEFLDFPVGQSAAVETPSKTYIEIIKSQAFIGEVVRKLGLDKVKNSKEGGISKLIPGFLRSAGDDLKQFFQDMVVSLKYGSLVRDDPLTNAVKLVQNNLTLKTREDTYLFEISYTATDPNLAADVANTTAKLFIDFMEELRSSEGKSLRDHLKTQLDQSRQQLESARERLESYKKAHSIFLYESEYDAKLKVITELEVELAKAEAALVGSQSLPSSVSLAARRARLLRSLRERQAELVPLPGIERELKQLELDVKAALTTYEIVDKEFKEASIKYSYAMPEVRLVSQAVAPHLPSSPIPVKVGLVSLLGGLIVAVGLGFFLEYLNRRIRGVHDVEDFVGLKVLATIPHVSPRHWRRAGL